MANDAKMEFYAAWPKVGTRFSDQLDESRVNSSSMNVLARAAEVDLNPDGVRKFDALSRWMQGQEDFFNKWSTYFDKDTGAWELQRNIGTETVPVWETVIKADSSGVLTDKDGADISPGFYVSVTARETDPPPSFDTINILTFNKESFYLTQGTSDREAIVNFRGTAGEGGSGTITGGTALGGDEDVFAGTSGSNLTFKGLSAGSNIVLSSDSNSITINSQSGSGFYGVNVKQVSTLNGDVQSFKGIDTLGFNADDFYLTQNSPNTDEILVNAKPVPGPQGPQGPAGADGADANPIGTFTESKSGIEWQVNHSLGSKPLLWSVFDDGDHFIIPEKVDVSDPNTAYFYFNESITGQVILSSGSPVESTGGGGGSGFYGINVKQVDESNGNIVSHSGINTLGFNNRYFYLTQNPPNTDESLINFRFANPETGIANLHVSEQIGINTTSPGDGLLLDVIETDSTSSNIRVKSDDASANIIIDSGLNSGNQSQLIFRDRGSNKVAWIKRSVNDLMLFDYENSKKVAIFGMHGNLHTFHNKLNLREGIQGFYLPMAEDVNNVHPQNNQVLTFDEATGQYGPEDSALATIKQVDTALGDIQTFSNVNELGFNNKNFYLTQNSSGKVLTNFRFTDDENIPGKLTVVNAAREISLFSGDGMSVSRLAIDAPSNSGLLIKEGGDEEWSIASAAGDLLFFNETTQRTIVKLDGVANTATTKDRVNLQGGIQGFYLPMAEDVNNVHPQNNQVLTFDEATGQYGPEDSAIDFATTTGEYTETHSSKLVFNRDDFYLTNTITDNYPVVNLTQKISKAIAAFSLKYPTASENTGGFHRTANRSIRIRDIHSVIRSDDQVNSDITWTIKGGENRNVALFYITGPNTTSSVTSGHKHNFIDIPSTYDNDEIDIWMETEEVNGTVLELTVTMTYEIED